MASSGVSGEGLITIVEPDSRAGASLDMVTNCGTFQGTIAPTTPTPSLRPITGEPSTPLRSSSHWWSLAVWMKVLTILHCPGEWARWENEMGAPNSVLMTWAVYIIREAHKIGS